MSFLQYALHRHTLIILATLAVCISVGYVLEKHDFVHAQNTHEYFYITGTDVSKPITTPGTTIPVNVAMTGYNGWTTPVRISATFYDSAAGTCAVSHTPCNVKTACGTGDTCNYATAPTITADSPTVGFTNSTASGVLAVNVGSGTFCGDSPLGGTQFYLARVAADGGGIHAVATDVPIAVQCAGTADYAITMSPTIQSVNRGDIADYTLTATGINNFTGRISSYLGYSFTPLDLDATRQTANTVVHVDTSLLAPNWTDLTNYQLYVTVKSDGGLQRSLMMPAFVTTREAWTDHSKLGISVQQVTSNTYTATFTNNDTVAHFIKIAADTPEYGLTIKADPPYSSNYNNAVKVQPGDSFDSTITVSWNSNVPCDTYVINIRELGYDTPVGSFLFTVPCGNADFSINGDKTQLKFINGRNSRQADSIDLTTTTLNNLTGDITYNLEWLTSDALLGWGWDGTCSANMTPFCGFTYDHPDTDQYCQDIGAGSQCIGDGANGAEQTVVTFPVSTENGSKTSWLTSVTVNHVGPDFPVGTTFQFRIKATHPTAGVRYFPSDGSYIALTVEAGETDNGITLVANPDNATVASGATAIFPLTLRAGLDYTGTTVNFTSSACPANATCVFLAGENQITNTNLAAGQSKSFSFRVQTQTGTEKTPQGLYDITVTGTDDTDPTIHSSDTVHLQVSGEPDFSITSVTPNPLTLDPNDVGSYTVTVGRTGGFTGDVKINWTAVPTP